MDKKLTNRDAVDNPFISKLKQILHRMGNNPDVVMREFTIGDTDIQAAIVYIGGLTDSNYINETILKTLMLDINLSEKWKKGIAHHELIPFIKNSLLSIGKIEEVEKDNMFSAILTGAIALIIEDFSRVILLESQYNEERNIDEPSTEPLVRGPKMGFVEDLQRNISIIRRYCPNPQLTLEQIEVGKRIKRKLVITYLADTSNKNLVKEVRQRIKKISVDHVLESGYIEQLIEDNNWSPFPQILSTERPDRAIGSLLEGRVVIILDGTPTVLILPATFSMMLQSPEDYYERWIPSSLIRILRYLSASISIFLPAIYISFVYFHQGLIPTTLAISIAGTRANVPFPVFIESFIMEISIELLREAGLRLPKPVGQTVGLVGGLVIGQSAVEAGLISPFMVIVVALTAITSFAIPVYNAGMALRVLRFGAMVFAALWGLFGVIMYFIFLCTHVIRLQSFGQSYASSMAPNDPRNLRDVLLRFPFKYMQNRRGTPRNNDKKR